MKHKLVDQEELLRRLPALLINDSQEGFPKLELPKQSLVWLVAAGKAGVSAVREVHKQLCNQIVDGLVIGPQKGILSDRIQMFEGAHPYPDEDTVAASYEIVNFVRKIPEGGTLILCISGGASSMFTIPPFGIEIKELQQLHRLLLNAGLSIQEMNIVRKHVCDVKGGKFADELTHLNVITIIDSDVPGDDLSTIGSGPTISDPSTFSDAFKILEKSGLWERVPLTIQEHIICGMEGIIPENPKPDDGAYQNQELHLISKINGIKASIKKELSTAGYNVWIDEEVYSGTVREVSKKICSKAISILSGGDDIQKPAALIFNGESTVKVIGNGKGGRNQELALMAALSIEGQHDISIFSMDTDGIDGSTEMAGAIINSETTLKARKQKIEPETLLKENNSYTFHKEMGTHIKTGLTGINAMDLQVVLVD